MRGIGTLLSLLLASSALAQGQIPWTQVKETCDMTIGDGTCGDVTMTYDGDAGTDGVFYWDVSQDNFHIDTPGTGANGAHEMHFGGSNYGGIKIGQTAAYCSSFSASNLDLDKAFLFRQEGNLGVLNDPGIEFAWMEQGNTIRMAIPESGAGNATAFIRSGTFAGPYSSGIGNDIVLCDTWSSYNGNIDCDTSSTGADLFIQDDLEVEGTIFAHETINLEGATADGNQVILQVGADPGADVTLTLPQTTGTLALDPLTTKGDIVTYSTATTRLGVGADNEHLVADSSTATGLKWESVSDTLGGFTVLTWANTTDPGGTIGAINAITWLDIPTVGYWYQGSHAQYDAGLSHRLCVEAWVTAGGCTSDQFTIRLRDKTAGSNLTSFNATVTASGTTTCSSFTWSAPATDQKIWLQAACTTGGTGTLNGTIASWVFK